MSFPEKKVSYCFTWLGSCSVTQLLCDLGQANFPLWTVWWFCLVQHKLGLCILKHLSPDGAGFGLSKTEICMRCRRLKWSKRYYCGKVSAEPRSHNDSCMLSLTCWLTLFFWRRIRPQLHLLWDGIGSPICEFGARHLGSSMREGHSFSCKSHMKLRLEVAKDTWGFQFVLTGSKSFL